MRHQTLTGITELSQHVPLAGVCCFGVDNLDQLALAAGDEAAEAALVELRARIGALFGVENVTCRRGVYGLIVQLTQADAGESLALVEQALSGVNDGNHENGSPVAIYAGIAWPDGLSEPGVIAPEGCGPLAERLTRAAIGAAATAQARRRDLCIAGEASRDTLQSAHLLCGLRDAMDEDRLIVLAQEIRSPTPHEGPERHYEILIQMADCQGKGQPPGRFLPLAERSALIESLDRWVFRRVLIGYGEELRQRPWISLSLNLSGRTLGQPDTWPFLEETIRDSGIAPERLHLEITETSKIADMEQAIATVRAARAAGLGVALDDFGAGLSGYAYLTAFDVNCIKIDGALIPNVVDKNSIETAVLRSIMTLARRLGLDVVAEHVSSAEILEAMTRLRVSLVQGFEVGMPRPLKDIFLDC